VFDFRDGSITDISTALPKACELNFETHPSPHALRLRAGGSRAALHLRTGSRRTSLPQGIAIYLICVPITLISARCGKRCGHPRKSPLTHRYNGKARWSFHNIGIFAVHVAGAWIQFLAKPRKQGDKSSSFAAFARADCNPANGGTTRTGLV
jgi:hypothetical protein